jgi:hypothetical protein
MVTDDVKRRADTARLISDLQSFEVELLSAQCATGRLQLHYSLPDIIALRDRPTLELAIASARTLHH